MSAIRSDAQVVRSLDTTEALTRRAPESNPFDKGKDFAPTGHSVLVRAHDVQIESTSETRQRENPRRRSPLAAPAGVRSYTGDASAPFQNERAFPLNDSMAEALAFAVQRVAQPCRFVGGRVFEAKVSDEERHQFQLR